MPDYVMLFNLTGKGAEKVKEFPMRLKDTKTIIESGGGRIKSFYAVLGRYDTVAIVDAPDDETIARLSLQLSSLGNVSTETLRAFTEDQFLTIINKIP